MPVETAPYIGSLVPSNPLDTDPEGQGGQQIRLVKNAVQASFPNVNGAVTATDVVMNTAFGNYGIQGFTLPLPPGTTDSNQGGQALFGLAGAAGALQGVAQVYENMLEVGLQTAPVIVSNSSTNTLNGVVSTTQTIVTPGTPVAGMALDASGNVRVTAVSNNGTGTATTGSTIYINSVPLSFLGEIRMFSGLASAIPSGWHICDGTNGTPNLLDRFIVGADPNVGATYPLGATGGSNFVTLTTAQLPPHNHGVNDAGHLHGIIDPGHAHGVTDPGHQHTFTRQGGVGVPAGSYGSWSGSNMITVTTAMSLTYLSINQAGTGITETQEAATGITIQSTGSGSPVDARPPFYALFYIMRIA